MVFKCIPAAEQRGAGKFIRQLKEGDEKGMCSSFERFLNQEKSKGKMEGRAEGKAKFVIELLEEIGTPSDALRKEIMKQTDLDTLRKWLKAATRAETIEDFERSIGLVQM